MVSIIILQAVSKVWFGLGYLFVVFMLYGLTSTLGAYVVSLFAKSQVYQSLRPILKALLTPSARGFRLRSRHFRCDVLIVYYCLP